MAFYNPTIITIPWAANGQKATIPNAAEAAGRASWPVGFPEVNALPLAAGGIPPNYLDFQGVLYALSAHAMYGQTGARYLWNSALDYPVGSYVRGSNGVEYVAIADSGPDSGGAVDPAASNSGQYWMRAATAQNVLPGVVVPFAGNGDLPGYLFCNGAAVSRTTYADLFAAIGTTYGAGDGSTTFNIPDSRDLFLQGSDVAGTVKAAGLPDIFGYIGNFLATVSPPSPTGCFSANTSDPDVNTNSTKVNPWRGIHFHASSSNAIYGASNTVQPPSLTMRYFIKY